MWPVLPVVYRIVFRETDVTRDPSERDLGAYRVESLYGKVNALYEGVCSVEIWSEGKRASLLREVIIVGRDLSKVGQAGKDSHEFGCRD